MGILAYEDLDDLDESGAEPLSSDALEIATESIDYAVEQLSTLFDTRSFIQNRDTISTEAFKLLRIVHESIAKDQRLMELAVKENVVFESIDETQFKRIMAAEADDGKNLLERLIDTVIKAFEWLWEKISGIFKSPPVEIDDTLEEKIGKAIDAAGGLKEAITLTGKAAPAAFSYIGETVTLSNVQEVLKAHKEQITQLRSFTDKLLSSIDPFNSVVVKLTPDSDVAEVKASLDQFAADFPNHFKEYMKLPFTVELAKEYGVKTSGEIDLNKSYAYGPILTNTGPGIFAYVTQKGSKGTPIFTASLSKKKLETSEKFKIEMGQDANAIKSFAKDLVEYSKKLGEEWSDVSSKESRMKSVIKDASDALTKVKKTVSAKDSPALTGLLKDMVQLSNAVGKVPVGLFGALNALKESLSIFDKLVQSTMKVISSKAKPEEGEKPTEETKPAEEKPAEAKT